MPAKPETPTPTSSCLDGPGTARQPGAVAVVGLSLCSLAAGTFALVSVGVLAPRLAPALGLSRAEVGVVSSLFAVGAALVSHPAGALTDRIGPARVLGVSLAGFGAAMALAAAAPVGGVLMAAALLGGAFYGGVNPPTNVMVAGRLSQRLGLFLSMKQSGVPFGTLVAGVTLPAFAEAFGWRAGLGLASGLLFAVAAASPLVRGAAVVRMHAGDGYEPMRRLELGSLGVFGFVMSGVQWAYFTYATLYLTQSLRFGHVVAGAGLAAAQAFGIVGRLTWGSLSDRSGKRVPFLLWIAAGGIVCLCLFAIGPGRGWVWPLLCASGFAIVGWNGAFHALVAERAGPGRIGRISGTILVFIFGGSVVFPPVGGALVDAFGSWRPLFVLSAAAVGVAAVVLWAGLRAAASRPALRQEPRAG